VIDPLGAALIIAVGVVAGTVNTIVGAGSLLTFPTLLFLGYPPLVANVSNTVGLVPGTISGAIGYRRELAGQGTRARPLLIAAGLGGVTGACLLLVLPAAAFARIVPLLILIALLAILVDDDLQRLNGLKNLITVVINGVAAVLFVVLAPVAWVPAILLAIGSIMGGQLGARVGRSLSPFALRAAIITVGTLVAVRLLLA
jgi:uncharacterized membrane protein YfcA